MKVILFNPLSKKGESLQILGEYRKSIKDKEEVVIHDIVNLGSSILGVLTQLSVDDQIIVIGGDGTLHQFVNVVKNIVLLPRVYLYKAGSGNDFSRDFKGKSIDITDYIANLPTCEVKNKSFKALNCCGFGVDSEVCNSLEVNSLKKNGIGYIKKTLQTFINFKRFDLDVIVDGKEYHYRNVWLSTIMNGKYIGGGMKLAPSADRLDDKLNIIVIHSVNLVKLLMIFPFIFIGKHMWFKNVGITELIGSSVTLKSSRGIVVQSDGEIYPVTDTIECRI